VVTVRRGGVVLLVLLLLVAVVSVQAGAVSGVFVSPSVQLSDLSIGDGFAHRERPGVIKARRIVLVAATAICK